MTLDDLAELGVSHVDMSAVFAGGRWHVEAQWVGNVPGRPMTRATEIGGVVERKATLDDALVMVAAQAAETKGD